MTTRSSVCNRLKAGGDPQPRPFKVATIAKYVAKKASTTFLPGSNNITAMICNTKCADHQRLPGDNDRRHAAGYDQRDRGRAYQDVYPPRRRPPQGYRLLRGVHHLEDVRGLMARANPHGLFDAGDELKKDPIFVLLLYE